MDPAIEQLHVAFKLRTVQDRRDLEAAWAAWQTESTDCPAASKLLEITHRLAGTAPSFGMDDLGQKARYAYEVALDNETSPSMIRSAVEKLLIALKQAGRY